MKRQVSILPDGCESAAEIEWEPDMPAAAAKRIAYPFSAIVGQDGLKHALMLSAVDPPLGVVVALGDRGSG